MSRALEHDHIGSTESSFELQNSCLELKQTELTLGLPGSQSRPALISVSLFGKELQHSDRTSNASTNKGCCPGSLKRVFSDTINWTFPGCNEADLGKNGSSTQYACPSATPKEETIQERKSQLSAVNEHGGPPAPKAQVVGWPPVRSFRKNTMVSNLAKNNDDDPSGCLYVKVSMEGAPYLRKIDLKTYRNYMELSSALEKMFSSFSYGKEGLCKSRLTDLRDGSEYALTYEDKDGDWMLVGDVPWEMFTDSCRRLKIMKGSEATGLDKSCNPPPV